jgi:hypothetical protein
VRRADNERDAAKAKLAAEQEYGEKAYPILTDGRLAGRKVGLVLLGRSGISPDDVREWLAPTGASLSLVAELRDDVDLEALAERARGTRYVDVADDPQRVGQLGRRAGIQLAQGGRLVQALRPALLQSLSGEIGDLDAVVVVRPPEPPKDKAAAERLSALQDGVVRGLGQTGVKVVGIEPSDSDPSQIGWYRDRELSTVDNIDENAGRAALVFVLAGADGAFGRRDGAQDLLPPVVATAPQRP